MSGQHRNGSVFDIRILIFTVRGGVKIDGGSEGGGGVKGIAVGEARVVVSLVAGPLIDA